jgi:hypothetical protein
MSSILPSQVNIIAVGVENYQYMTRLNGPKRDVLRFVDVLSKSSSTGVFLDSKIVTLLNPDTNGLRKAINDLIINSSLEGEALIFYFSGHGIPISHHDFGFCTIDSRIHDESESLLPLTVLKLKDILDTLHVMNVIPIFIIDACYSGIAGNAVKISINNMITSIHSLITESNATNYALFCACTDREFSFGYGNGGVFSQLLLDVLENGLQSDKYNRKPMLNLQDVFSQIRTKINDEFTSSTPQLFLGQTLPEFPIVKNSKYDPIKYQFTPYLKKILEALWKDGNEAELKIGDFISLVGRGAYGNHRKLSIPVWNLVEDNPQTKKRRLTNRGREFVQGKSSIPDIIVFDYEVDEFIAAPNAIMVSINDI